ncbi:hypothetical protein SAMN05421847_2051 [Halpernia humi]|uniref:Uncharacterized protein n=1 Tax=Halpernia humi TaxID=493375 RepID=A0A1H5ZA10_9FLAO|nr:hypothetical protein SAMN05421847_2051 [Halpernia humi]
MINALRRNIILRKKASNVSKIDNVNFGNNISIINRAFENDLEDVFGAIKKTVVGRKLINYNKFYSNKKIVNRKKIFKTPIEPIFNRNALFKIYDLIELNYYKLFCRENVYSKNTFLFYLSDENCANYNSKITLLKVFEFSQRAPPISLNSKYL